MSQNHPSAAYREIAAARLRNQRLLGSEFESAADVVRWLGAVQAQDYYGSKWGIAQRLSGFNRVPPPGGVERDRDGWRSGLATASPTAGGKPQAQSREGHAGEGIVTTDAALDRAFDEGALIRTHVMRPTWHFVAPEDLRWLLELTGPRVDVINSHYCRRLELDERTLLRGCEIFHAGLQGGRHCTREELRVLLGRGGVEASGQRLGHLVMHAELQGVICSGPRRGKQFTTYALLEERVPPAPARTREEALAELTRRYFRSHGPATVHDFSWWSGLTVNEVRRGIESVRGELTSRTVNGVVYWSGEEAGGSAVPPNRERRESSPGDPPAGAREDDVFHLLPNWDEHVVAYRDRTPSLDPATGSRFAAGVRSDPPVTRNGLIVGSWRRTLRRDSVVLIADLVAPVDSGDVRHLEDAASAYGTHLGLPVELQIKTIPPTAGR